jgi:homoserine kinase type II
MAVYTRLSAGHGRALAEAHRIAGEPELEGIAAGSVNTNYWLRAGGRSWFVRVYEEQDRAGAEWEWRLLDRLHALGLPVAVRCPGEPIAIEGKPAALFEPLGGTASCQAGVTVDRARAVGRVLARVHRGTRTYPEPRASRFGVGEVLARIPGIDTGARPELEPLLARITAMMRAAGPAMEAEVPRSIVHGDLFRDNVHFEGDEIVGVLDWESASTGPSAFDVAVAMLAWCFGDTLDRGLCRALAAGYGPLTTAERSLFRDYLRIAAGRFVITRLTDYELRAGKSIGVYKDYRRFVDRLDAVEAMDAGDCARELLA